MHPRSSSSTTPRLEGPNWVVQWLAFGWWQRPLPSSYVWNGDFEASPTGGQSAAVTNINGATTLSRANVSLGTDWAPHWPDLAMRMRGLEPPRGCPHTDLNRARLPIPPHPRASAV